MQAMTTFITSRLRGWSIAESSHPRLLLPDPAARTLSLMECARANYTFLRRAMADHIPTHMAINLPEAPPSRDEHSEFFERVFSEVCEEWAEEVPPFLRAVLVLVQETGCREVCLEGGGMGRLGLELAALGLHVHYT